MKRTELNIEHVLELQRQYREIDNLDISTVDFFKNGNPVTVDPKAIEDWKYVGLGLVHFVELSPDVFEEKQVVWHDMSTYPEKPCLVKFKLLNGTIEMGKFDRVSRKDGIQLCPIGHDGWLTFWRIGDRSVKSWTEREESENIS